MKFVDNPGEDLWPVLTRRPGMKSEYLEGVVRVILGRVRSGGDVALKELTATYDKVALQAIQVSEAEFSEAQHKVDDRLKSAMRLAARNIARFHQPDEQESVPIETMPGVSCWRRSAPIQRVGIYVPGGQAPLFSTVLMLAIPAQLARCPEVIVCSPPRSDGSMHPAILFAATLAGVNTVFKIGGAQAIAAMAYGTETIRPVLKIVGPGNQFVTKAKQLVNSEGVAIDMPAGPSELMVIADEGADPEFVAADLVSQAEHGPDSQVILLSPEQRKIEQVLSILTRYQSDPDYSTVLKSSLSNSLAIRFEHMDTLMRFANLFAPEHLIINTADCESLSKQVTNAGSVFLGPWSAEAAGDYATGPNHTLPTNGYARAYSGVGVESFQKSITLQKLTRQGLEAVSEAVITMATAEGLPGHRNAIQKRLAREK